VESHAVLVHLVRLIVYTSGTRTCLLLALILGVVAVSPAFAQVELSGSWAARNNEDAMERGAGPYAVDYTGLPLNDEGRARALSYSASQMFMIERQCALWSPFYFVLGPFGLKIWNETDPINGETVAWKIGAWEDRFETTIWMDGRPHPSESAVHGLGGFTTGEWVGNMLVATTTHLKPGAIRRNGAPSSDRATMTTYFMRNENLMTVLAVLDDPVYLSEPLLVSKNFELGSTPISPIGPPCVPGYEGGGESVPHHLPGENAAVDELTTLYGIPRDAVLGGAQTMYPEYRERLRQSFVRPEKCVRNCGGRGGR